MSGLSAARGDLGALMTGGPCLLVPGDAPVPALPGIALWRATAEDAGFRLHRGNLSGNAVPLPGVPAGLLGVLPGEGAAALAALAGVPVIEDLAALLAAALAARTAEVARLTDAAARLRAEAEETREAMAALLRATGHDTAPAPALAIATEPSSRAQAKGGDGGLVLAQRLGCSLEGIAAVALHVAAAGTGPARIRLKGAESDRVRAAWALPAEALVPGWLTLDLPTPLGPIRETAVLEVVAEGALALSLEEAEAPPDRCPALEAGTAPTGRALALKVFAAPMGRRFVLSPWWDWEAQDLPPALPLRLPEAAWAGARILAGRGRALATGTEAARPMLALAPGEAPALVALPALPVTGIDLVEAEVAVRLGEAGALEAALWALPEGETLADPDVPPQGARGTGWRRADGARGGVTLALRLGSLEGMAGLVLALRHAGEAGPLQAEWAEVVLRRLSPALPPAPPRAAATPSPGFVAAVPDAAVPRLDGADPVRLMEHYNVPGGGYRHLDIQVEGLRLGALAWPRLRFKFAVKDEAPQIEVRARPDWPVLFERWPGSAVDEHGPFFVLDEAARGGRAAGLMRTPRDRRLLEALLALLPTLVATAARAATSDPAEYADWVAMARRYAAALQEQGG